MLGGGNLQARLTLVSRSILSAVALSTCPSSLQSQRSFFTDRTMAQEPVVIPATGKHSATVIFLHGLGDTGHGWSPVFQDMIREPHIKYICPHAPTRPVTLNMGMRMPAWFDIYGLSLNSNEDVDGINEATKTLHGMIEAEAGGGIGTERILVGGFSMGGALSLYAALTYDKPLAGVVALSSFLLQRDKLPGSSTANKHVSIFQGHGDSDPLVAVEFGKATAQMIKSFNPNVELKIYPGMGHSACDQEFKDVKDFISMRLPPK